MATAVVGVNGCAPAVAPFDCRMNEVMAAYSPALSVDPVGGIVADM